MELSTGEEPFPKPKVEAGNQMPIAVLGHCRRCTRCGCLAHWPHAEIILDTPAIEQSLRAFPRADCDPLASDWQPLLIGSPFNNRNRVETAKQTPPLCR
jgi:hypothetical protein